MLVGLSSYYIGEKSSDVQNMIIFNKATECGLNSEEIIFKFV